MDTSVRSTFTEYRHFQDQEAMADALIKDLTLRIQWAVNRRGICHIVLPGGKSPWQVLHKLISTSLPWPQLHIYLSDERCVQIGSLDRNDRLIDDLLINNGLLPQQNLHRIPVELGAEKAALHYAQYLQNVPLFDIVLLGVGEDGHTASLFPQSSSLTDEKAVLAIYDAPKKPKERVSLGITRLRHSRERWVLIPQIEKKHIYQRMRLSENNLPIVQTLPTKVYVGFLGD